MHEMITVCLSYYNQPVELVHQHIREWQSYPEDIKNKFTFFIIDDASKVPLHEIIDKTLLKNLDVHVYRVKEDLYCNIAGVRNLGAKECRTPWMVILDMDTLIPKETAKGMIKFATECADKNFCLKFIRKVPSNVRHIKHNQFHPAVCLLRVVDYWNVGGCDEDLVGHYGNTDPIFWYRAQGKLNVLYTNDLYLIYIPEGEADIDRDTTHNKALFERKRKDNSWSTNFIRFNWDKVTK